MAKASVWCTCAVCGTEFRREKICRNRSVASAWEAWAVDHIDLCPDCWKKEQAAKQAEIAAQYPLPALEGKSEKQTAYATSLRNRYIAEHGERMDEVAELVRDLADPEGRAEIEQDLAASGETLEQAIDSLSKSPRWKIPWAILHETNAGKLLDVLARR